VPLIENDHVVEQVSTYAPDPALRHPVLPRTAKGGAHRLSAIVFHGRNDIGTEFRITIEDEKSGWWFETPSFAQLQDDPEGIRLPSYAAVQDLPPVVTNDKEAIQNAECECGHGKKVHRRNGLAMVSQECQPATPAMEAGLTDHVWTLTELCSLLPQRKPNARIDKELILRALQKSA
jgi:hypothetical protein